MADRFVETGHSKQGDVRSRQKEVKEQWKRLLELKAEKEKMLEGASRYELPSVGRKPYFGYIHEDSSISVRSYKCIVQCYLFMFLFCLALNVSFTSKLL